MTARASRVTFDDLADIVIKGRVGGRQVEYSGSLSGFDIVVDDDIKPYLWYLQDGETWWPDLNNNRLSRPSTYIIKFEGVDGKAITAKIGKKPVRKSASTYFDGRDTAADVDKVALECGVSGGSRGRDVDYEIDSANKQITFTWTEEVT